ncbi:glycosyl transferase [Salinimicrobium marinum]|uniref:Glycosyl transferase n=1 Tax=Salinimicrobium marinum TaxID=680283 RepID=A0A918SI43_9FLAO|nr:glycosyltransferase family 4 protein [Salinimicrobium marinum]GHA45483.1 glycosyl transferase [Salinimicrobium marinum]
MEGKGMKILMTTDTVGGVWVYSLELCKALQEYDVEVHLAAMGAWPSEAQKQQVETIKNVTLYKSDFKLEWMEDPWEDVEKSNKWINSIYHTIYPDVVHMNNYAHIGEDWTCPTLTVFHSCVQTWWQAVKGTSAPTNWDRYTQVVKESLEASDIVVSPTQSILGKAKNTHDFSSPAKVIYNGRAMDASEEKEKEPFILCIGRIWDEAKNLKLLSHIAKNLPWPVYIAGTRINPGSGEKSEFENVKFLGKLEPHEVEEWMQRASIFVSPTKYEPFGLAILEAAKSGCALILSELDTLKEIWEDSAAFFDPENEADAQERILQLINNEAARKELSERARNKAKEYSSEKMASEYMDLYREIINNKSKPKLATV